MTTGESCRRCGRPLWWARTSAGKPIPLDPAPGDPLPGRFTVDLDRAPPAARYVDAHTAETHEQSVRYGFAVPRAYACHYETCPRR